METEDLQSPNNDDLQDVSNANGNAFATNTSLGASDVDQGGFPLKGISSRPGSSHTDRIFEPMQTATPPTTNSPDQDEPEKVAKRAAFSGMNPARMRQLGLYDGATD